MTPATRAPSFLATLVTVPALLALPTLLTVALGAFGACDKTQAAHAAAPREGGSAVESGADACTSDNCIVPLADIGGVCGPTLNAATKDCPGTAVSTGPCGTVTHVVLTTAGPAQDCFYDTASGALVGGIVRSDAGFTKIAGTIPGDACPASTKVCDHHTT